MKKRSKTIADGQIESEGKKKDFFFFCYLRREEKGQSEEAIYKEEKRNKKVEELVERKNQKSWIERFSSKSRVDGGRRSS